MSGPIPVLVLACDRPAYLERTLSSIFRHDDEPGRRIIVSQHGTHEGVSAAIGGYAERIEHLQFRDPFRRVCALRLWRGPLHAVREHWKWNGHYRISRHYKWAFTRVMEELALARVIVLEDDLEIAPDFFAFFRACAPLLDRDPSLLTVSAWNDNGRAGLASDPRFLYRTDCFPGLGWLLTRHWWQVVKPDWPVVFWDDWLRRFGARRGLSSIYPEVSRTFTFGEIGVSGGQYYERYLAPSLLNETPVDFASADLSTLDKEAYDTAFHGAIAQATLVSGDELPVTGDVKIPFHGESGYMALAERFRLIPEFRSGAPRTSYQGVVAVRHDGRRIFLVPLAYLTARGQLPAA